RHRQIHGGGNPDYQEPASPGPAESARGTRSAVLVRPWRLRRVESTGGCQASAKRRAVSNGHLRARWPQGPARSEPRPRRRSPPEWRAAPRAQALLPATSPAGSARGEAASRLGSASRREAGPAACAPLLLHAVDVAQDPDVADLSLGHLEEGAPGPGNLTPGGRNPEKKAAVYPGEAHPGGRLLLGRYQLFDDAPVVAECGVDRAHVFDEPVLPSARGTERSAEAQLRVEDFARRLLIGAVPDVRIEAFHERFRIIRHAAAPQELSLHVSIVGAQS